MYEYISLGSTPCNESCAQVGDHKYYERAKAECRAYINQLERSLIANGYPKEDRPHGFSFVIKGEHHDLGTYYEVYCKVKESDEQACELAYFIESNAPYTWDHEAKLELLRAFSADDNILNNYKQIANTL